MWKYTIFIILGILLFLLLNQWDTLNIGNKCPSQNDSECNDSVGDCNPDRCQCNLQGGSYQCVLKPDEGIPPLAGGGASGNYVPLESIQCNTPVDMIDVNSLINVTMIQSESWFIDFNRLVELARDDNTAPMEVYLRNIFRAINIYIPPGNCDLGDLDEIIDYNTMISDFITDNEDIDSRASFSMTEFNRRYNTLLILCAIIVLTKRIDVIEGRESRLQRLDSREVLIKEDYNEDILQELVMERLLPGINIDEGNLIAEIQLLKNNIDMNVIINMSQLNNAILQIQLNFTPVFRFGAPITQESLLRGISPATRGQLTLRDVPPGSEGSQCNSIDLIELARKVGGGAAGAADVVPCHNFLWCNENVCRPIPRLMGERIGTISSIIENSQGAFGENSHIYIRLDNESGRVGPTHKCKYTIQDGSIISIYKLLLNGSYELFVKFSLCSIYKMDPEPGQRVGEGTYVDKLQFKLIKEEGSADLSGSKNRIHVYKLTQSGYNQYFPNTATGVAGSEMKTNDYKSFDYLKMLTMEPDFKINRCSGININPITQFSPGRLTGLTAEFRGACAAHKYQGFEFDTNYNSMDFRTNYEECNILINSQNKSLDIYYEGPFVRISFDKTDIGYQRIILYKKDDYFYIKILYEQSEFKIRTRDRTIRNKGFGNILLMLTIERLFGANSDLIRYTLMKVVDNLIYPTLELFKEHVIDNLVLEEFQIGLDTMGDDF
jgi:hypothetical protein